MFERSRLEFDVILINLTVLGLGFPSLASI